MKNLNFLLPFLLLTRFGICSDTLPPVADLYASLDAYYLEASKVGILALSEDDKDEWMKYLPTLGISNVVSFDGDALQNKLRPSVSWNSNILYTTKKERQRRKLKSLEIQERLKIEHRLESDELFMLLRNYQLKELEIKEFREIVLLDSIVFYIHHEKHLKDELKPLDYILKKKLYLSQKFTLRRKLDVLKNLEFEIIRKARFSIYSFRFVKQ